MAFGVSLKVDGLTGGEVERGRILGYRSREAPDVTRQSVRIVLQFASIMIGAHSLVACLLLVLALVEVSVLIGIWRRRHHRRRRQ